MVAKAKEPVKFKPMRLGVHFTNVSIGDLVASIGVKMSLEEIAEEKGEEFDRAAAVARAFKNLCARQIKAILILGKRNDGETQGKLIATDIELTAVYDTNRLSVGPKDITFKVSAKIKEISTATLIKFAKRDGYIKITSVMDEIALPEDLNEEEGERPLLDK